jgi:hypothetical protein
MYGMAEPVRHGAHVDPRGQQFGGNEMPNVMDANVAEPGRLAEAFPAAGDQLRPQWPLAIGVVGEDQIGRLDLTPDGDGPPLREVAVTS